MRHAGSREVHDLAGQDDARVIGLLDFPGHQTIFNVDFQLQEPVQLTPWVERTILSNANAGDSCPPSRGCYASPVRDIGKGFALLFEVAKAIQKFTLT